MNNPKRFDNPKSTQLRRTAWILDDGDDHTKMYVREHVYFDDRNPHNLVTSLAAEAEPGEVLGTHYPVLDIDGPARVVPSATPGHFHLYIDKPVSQADYFEFLRAAKKIGLLEPGYVDASISRGFSAAFLPEF